MSEQGQYYCVICDKYFNDDPHTDPETGEDCHAKCCPVCNSAHMAEQRKKIYRAVNRLINASLEVINMDELQLQQAREHFKFAHLQSAIKEMQEIVK